MELFNTVTKCAELTIKIVDHAKISEFKHKSTLAVLSEWQYRKVKLPF